MKVPEGKSVIIFDGVCNLCNGSVNFVIKRDPRAKFMYSALQSDFGKQILEKFEVDSKKTDSIIFYNPEKGISVKSTAILNISKGLGFPYSLMVVFFILPPFIRNWIYDIIAKNRYKWFGKKDSCMIPTPELSSRFIN